MSEITDSANTLTLRVAEAIPRDMGRTIARLDPSDLKLLGLNIGDTIEIKGSRSSGAKVMPAFAADRGKRLILIDGLIRANCGVSLGETVSVSKTESLTAKVLVLTPTEEGNNPERSVQQQLYLKRSLEGIIVKPGDLVRVNFVGSGFQEFLVHETEPAQGLLVVGPGTNLKFNLSQADRQQMARRTGSGITYEDIGGLSRQLDRIREMIELPLRYPEIFERLGIDPPKGVLLYGPPGSGKTLIARAVANETSAHFISVSGPEIIQKFYGESEANLRKVFQEATSRAPSIIFLDEIDSLAPRREQVQGEVEKRVVGTLLTLMDGLRGRGAVIVIGATNLPNNLDPALRRPGRFDREISIGVPDRPGREEILTIFTRAMPLSPEVDLSRLASLTHGFVGADLGALCREAALSALRRVIPNMQMEKSAIPYEQFMNLDVRMEDFLAALKEIEPSAIREVYTEVPDVSWDKIGGLEEVKEALREAVEWPLAYPELFERTGTKPPRGMLLYGPPGCGKTLLAQALATESEINFISVKGPELLSKWVGESEKAVREIFRKARQAAPCIIFFDEIDAIAPARGMRSTDGVSDRVVAQLLTEIDGIEEAAGLIILGATNRPEMLDPALLRPGRFDLKVAIPEPDAAARRQILEVHTATKPLADPSLLDWLVPLTEHLVGAELEALCNRASLNSIRRAIAQIKKTATITDAPVTSYSQGKQIKSSTASAQPLIIPDLLKEDFEEALAKLLAMRQLGNGIPGISPGDANKVIDK